MPNITLHCIDPQKGKCLFCGIEISQRKTKKTFLATVRPYCAKCQHLIDKYRDEEYVKQYGKTRNAYIKELVNKELK